MEKTYSPKDIEQTCYERWEEEGYFSPQGEGKPYCIMLPPPNVTGSLHMSIPAQAANKNRAVVPESWHSIFAS